MKRVVNRWRCVAITCIVLGLVVNIAVALILAAKAEPLSIVSAMRGSTQSLPATIGWPGPVPPHWPVDQSTLENAVRPELAVPWDTRWSRSVVRTPIQSNEVYLLREPNETSMWYHYRINRYGFPFQALRRDSVMEIDMRPTKWPPTFEMPVAGVLGGVRHKYSVGTPFGSVSAFPVVPVPLGFIGNTLVYAATIWATWFLSRVVRQRVSRRPGQCEKCGYQVDSLAICPECGTPSVTPALESVG